MFRDESKKKRTCAVEKFENLIFDVFYTNWKCSHIEIKIICQFGVSCFIII